MSEGRRLPPIRVIYGRAGSGPYLEKCSCRRIVTVPEGGQIVTCLCGRRFQWGAGPKTGLRQVVITENNEEGTR